MPDVFHLVSQRPEAAARLLERVHCSFVLAVIENSHDGTHRKICTSPADIVKGYSHSDRTGKAYDDSYNTDVWVIPASGGTPTKISDHAFEDESPRWSPDSKQILFTGNGTPSVPKALHRRP